MPAARALARLRLQPDHITILGALISLAAGAAVGAGHLFAGGWLFLAGGSLDLLDGALARALGKTTKRGALLDSTLDRVGEMGLFIGLAAWYGRQAAPAEAALAAAALATSTLVSYVKARAEGLGLAAPTGLLTRPERVAVLALGLLLAPAWGRAPLAALASVTALSALTALLRFLGAWRTPKR
jgi:CDP-diacylglycerol--glycerol-3-phosphate 3-phosphatidyltransferase